MLPLSEEDAPLWTTSDSRFDDFEHYLRISGPAYSSEDDLDDDGSYSFVEPERYIG